MVTMYGRSCAFGMIAGACALAQVTTAQVVPTRLDLIFNVVGSGPEDARVSLTGITGSFPGSSAADTFRVLPAPPFSGPVQNLGNVTVPEVTQMSAAEFVDLMSGEWRIEWDTVGGTPTVGTFSIGEVTTESIPDPGSIEVLEPATDGTVGPEPFVVRWDAGELEADPRLVNRSLFGRAFGAGTTKRLLTDDADLSDGEAIVRIGDDGFGGIFGDDNSDSTVVTLPANLNIEYTLDVSDDWQVIEPTAVFDTVNIFLSVTGLWTGDVLVPEPTSAAFGLAAFVTLTCPRRRCRVKPLEDE